MASKVLITGGTGSIGRLLCDYLDKNGFEVSILSRSQKPNTDYKSFVWNYQEKFIDKAAFKDCDYIIHLAGAGIADAPWSAKRKKEILDSRVQTTKLIYDGLAATKHHVKAVISASAVGFYGQVSSEKIFKETDPPGKDFVASICTAWEKEVNRFKDLDIRTVNLRIGIVLMEQGGALEKMAELFRYNLGSPLGNGKQIIPWIHISDLIGIIHHSLLNEKLEGPYNCSAPEASSNEQFSKLIAKALGKKIWLPKVPKIALKTLLGERSILLTEGSQVSSKKIIQTGFKFKIPKLEPALRDLL